MPRRALPTLLLLVAFGWWPLTALPYPHHVEPFASVQETAPPQHGERGQLNEADRAKREKEEQEENWHEAGKRALTELASRGKVYLRLVFYPSPEQTVTYEEVQSQVPLALKAIFSDPELAPPEGARSVMQTGQNRILFSRRMGNWELLEALTWEVSGEWDELVRKAPLIYRHLTDKVEFTRQGILRLYIGFQTDPPRMLRLFVGPYYYSPPIELDEFLNQRAVADAQSWSRLYELFQRMSKDDPKLSDKALSSRLDELMMLKDRVVKELLKVVDSPPKSPAGLISFVELNRGQLGEIFRSDNFKRFKDAYLYLEADLRAVESRMRELIEKEAPELDQFKFMLRVVVNDQLDRLD